MEWMILRTLGSLASIVALMLGLAYLLKRYLHAGKARGRNPVEVELLGHRSLAPRTSVFVLRVLNQVIVVGTSERGLQTLSEISDPESLSLLEDRMMGGSSARRLPWTAADLMGGARSFSEYLRHQIFMVPERRKGPRKGQDDGA